MKRKLLIMVISVVLSLSALTAFAGCKPANVNDPQTIKVAAFKGAYGDAFWPDIKKEFEKLYAAEGYKVEYTAASNIEDVVRPQIRAGNGPDVMYLATGREQALTEQLMDSGAILKINDLLEEKVPGEDVKLKDKILPGFIGNNATNLNGDDDVFMLPLFYSTNGLFYNKALFNETGSNGKYKMPTTWDELIALKTQAQADGRALMAYARAGYLDNTIMSSILANAGEAVLKDFLAYENVYDNANVKAVFEKLSKLSVHADSYNNIPEFLDAQNALLQNEALFLPCGNWIYEEMKDYTPVAGFEYGFTAPFAFEKGQDRYASSMLEQIYVLSTSKKQEVAKKFVAFMYSDTAVKIVAKNSSGIIPTVNSTKLAKEVYEGISDAAVKASRLQNLEVYNIFGNDIKPLVGASFVSTDKTFVGTAFEGYNNWKWVYCFDLNKVMKGTLTLDGWINNIKGAAAVLKPDAK